MERGGGGAGPSSVAEEDAPFRSRALAEKVRQHHLWHGDLLADPASFAAFRAWRARHDGATAYASVKERGAGDWEDFAVG